MDNETVREINLRKIQSDLINAERALIRALQIMAECRFQLDDLNSLKPDDVKNDGPRPSAPKKIDIEE